MLYFSFNDEFADLHLITCSIVIVFMCVNSNNGNRPTYIGLHSQIAESQQGFNSHNDFALNRRKYRALYILGAFECLWKNNS